MKLLTAVVMAVLHLVRGPYFGGHPVLRSEHHAGARAFPSMWGHQIAAKDISPAVTATAAMANPAMVQIRHRALRTPNNISSSLGNLLAFAFRGVVASLGTSALGQ